MNKKDLALVVVLIVLIPVWLAFDRFVLKPMFPAAPVPVATAAPAALPDAEVDSPPVPAAPAPVEEAVAAPVAAGAQAADVISPAVETLVEAQTVVLKNDVIVVELSNLGAVVSQVDLLDYPATLEDKISKDGKIVTLDFAEASFSGLMYNMVGLNQSSAFEVARVDENTVAFSREVLPGLRVIRTYILGDGYVLDVNEEWRNETGALISISPVDLYLGAMYPQPNISQKFGPFVGIDAKHVSPTGVKHYVKTLRKNVGDVDGVYTKEIEAPLEWVGVKNKFFTQVLTLNETDETMMSELTLRATAGKKGDAAISYAQPSVRFDAVALVPGAPLIRDFSYYVGPISMENLKALGGKQEELIDFRLFKFIVPLGKLMMLGLNKLYALTGNWGIAIILLTFVVRMLFWPLTQKGAENMKRMSELSPQMKELKEKHKNNPQKLNAEMSAFYKANKVNPLAGCLPMVVQIPVFISLYGVLRVAVELRFAEFLWIKDLSEQEAIFYLGTFPVNILPLTMGATMVLQQRLTPSNMDEQQKKIMMMMPIVFLFICYNMPAGLLLYWTTSNLISIYQTTHTKRRDAKKASKSSAETSTGKMKSVKNPQSSPSKTPKK
ncbi:membrane protein insertase YidC [Kiritimatiellota bacterium B12222]|nr:membrane protein insertase YidC [Kiritimatiellota bacterium B12222]